MTRSHKIIGFVIVMVLGVYGCAKGPVGSEKNPSLEAKVQRLEEDFRAAASARDQFKQKLLAAEERQSQLQKQLDQDRATALVERDALKAEVKARTTERDTLASQYEGFRKGLKDLLGQAETALANPNGTPAPPVVVGSQTTSPTPTIAPIPIPTESGGSTLRN